MNFHPSSVWKTVGAIVAVAGVLLPATILAAPFTPPSSNHVDYNFNYDWLFLKSNPTGGASAVTFDGVPAESFTVNSSTSITAVSPSAAASGTVNVVVWTPTGDSAISSSDEFTYSAASAPTLSSLSLTSGSTTGGIVVDLTGSHFTGATAVDFGTTAASFAARVPPSTNSIE